MFNNFNALQTVMSIEIGTMTTVAAIALNKLGVARSAFVFKEAYKKAKTTSRIGWAALFAFGWGCVYGVFTGAITSGWLYYALLVFSSLNCLQWTGALAVNIVNPKWVNKIAADFAEDVDYLMKHGR